MREKKERKKERKRKKKRIESKDRTNISKYGCCRGEVDNYVMLCFPSTGYFGSRVSGVLVDIMLVLLA